MKKLLISILLVLSCTGQAFALGGILGGIMGANGGSGGGSESLGYVQSGIDAYSYTDAAKSVTLSGVIAGHTLVAAARTGGG